MPTSKLVPVAAVVVTAFLVLGAAYMVWQQLDQLWANPVSLVLLPVTTGTPSIPTSWQTYHNEEYGFEVRCPQKFFVIPLSASDPKSVGFYDDPVALAGGVPPIFNITVDAVSAGRSLRAWINSSMPKGDVVEVTFGSSTFLRWTGSSREGTVTTVFSTMAGSSTVISLTETGASTPKTFNVLSTLKSIPPTPLGTGTPSSSSTSSIKACTQEAKMCPDGTAVGRVGPSCEFAPCPATLQGTLQSCVPGKRTCPAGFFCYDSQYGGMGPNGVVSGPQEGDLLCHKRCAVDTDCGTGYQCIEKEILGGDIISHEKLCMIVGKQSTKNPTGSVFCGGIAGIPCPTGQRCVLDGNYPDAGGTCVTGGGRSGEICAQVITRARNPQTGEERDFPTPCSVPAGWEIIH